MTDLVGQFVDWCEANGLNVAEAMRVLNAPEPEDDEEYCTMPAAIAIHEDFV
jgi:hypothetical protein